MVRWNAIDKLHCRSKFTNAKNSVGSMCMKSIVMSLKRTITQLVLCNNLNDVSAVYLQCMHVQSLQTLILCTA